MKIHHAFVALALFSTGCASFQTYSNASGTFQNQGDARWALQVNSCTAGTWRGYFGVDLYRADPKDDTEVVLVLDSTGYHALVRIPHQGKMVVVRPSDCSTFDATLGYNGIEINESPGIQGKVSLDCTKSSLGHVEGTAQFVCY